MSMDEDENSEVETLSISSGDEDEGKDPKGGAGGRPRGRPMKDDDGAWDGEEPDTWKRVDEAELSRRVRAMRDTRTAPSAQKFERKATAPTGRVLTAMQSFPRGMECVDPLGLGLLVMRETRTVPSAQKFEHTATAPMGIVSLRIIDNKTLRLITYKSEGTHAEKDHIDSNHREKLVYFSENFDAKLFLHRVHEIHMQLTWRLELLL